MAVAPQQPPQVTKSGVIATTWSLFAVSLLFFVARIGVRLKVSHRLFWDDAWASIALMVLLGLALTLTIVIPSMYVVLNLGSGLEQPGPTFMSDGSFFLKLQFALTMLYWSCLWAVKACFLAFFHRLTKGLIYCRWAWWATVAIVTLSYLGCVITYPISCSSFTIGECECEFNISRSLLSLRYSTAVDIITDALIMALPLYLAIRVQLPLSQKLALGAVFSLGAVIMAFAIIRIVVTNQHNTHPETSWLNLWSQIEASVAVIISALAPFKVLFTGNKLKSYENNKSPHGISHVLSGMSGGRSGQRIGAPQAIPLDERSHAYAENGNIGFSGHESHDSKERIIRGYDAYGQPIVKLELLKMFL